MIRELLKMREVFVDIDRSLEHIMFSLASKYGLTREQVDVTMEFLYDRKERS
jgi:hypothetical protein